MKKAYIDGGTYGVVLTPFDENGHLDQSALRKELNYCVNTKATGLLLCGSTGEFVYMDQNQQKDVLRIGMEEAGNKKKLIGGASAATERAVLEFLEYMSELGYEYAMICPPYYYPQSPENVVSFYETISRKAPTGIKLLMYNIPFCSPEIPLKYMERLLQIPNIVGMKDSSGNMMYLSKVMGMVNEVRPDFNVFTGQDSAFLPSLTIGVSGCMSALCWMIDGAVSGIMEAYFKLDLKTASEIQMKIIQLVRHLDAIAFPENYRVLSEIVGISAGKPQRSLYNLNKEFCSQWITKAVELVQTLRVK